MDIKLPAVVITQYIYWFYTYSLSQKTFAAPSIVTPIIINLYLNEMINSGEIHIAKNSYPKV